MCESFSHIYVAGFTQVQTYYFSILNSQFSIIEFVIKFLRLES